MPSLVICGHRTFVAGDDLRTFTFFAILLRLIQLAVLIPYTKETAYLYRLDPEKVDECNGTGAGETLINASYTILVAFICSAYVTVCGGILLEVGIWRTGARGTPVETEKRACLNPLCRIKMIPMTVLRIGNVVMGVMIMRMIQQFCYCGGLYDDPLITCPNLLEFRGYLSILIASFFIEGGIVGLMGLYFACKTQARLPSLMSTESKWRCCCRCCCTITSILTCCLYGGRDGKTGDFADIALILSDFFDDGGALDVVASDVVVGLKTLARVQNQKEGECRMKLKRRVSFVTSVKPVDEQEAISPDFGDVVQVETDDPNRLRVVTFSDEEIGLSASEDAPDDRSSEMEGKGTLPAANDVWKGRVCLQDEEIGEVVVAAKECSTLLSNEEAALGDTPKDSQLSELMNAAEVEEDDDTSDDIVLAKVGSEKTIRRKSVVYSLHRSAGYLHYKAAVREVLSRKNSEDKLAIAEGARYIRFAEGIYFFRKYIASGRSCETCYALGDKSKNVIEFGRRLMNSCRDKANTMAGHDLLDFRVGNGYMIGHIKEANFRSLAGLEQAEVKYVQFGEGVARTPYCISADHAWKSIVVAIRGTEGLDDVVADLRMVPVSMRACGSTRGFNGHGYYVHAGMLACAEWIYDDLESHGIVDKMLAEYPGYNLRLCGHSLGAGTAAILSFMLRGKHPSLKCSCFCPPGCSVSENMAEECKDYVTSYVLDHDIVPRMSFGSLENLRDDMLDIIARLKVTKYQANHAKPDTDKDMLLHRQESIPPSKFQEQVEDFREKRREGEATMRGMIRAIALYPPGKIVQLVKTEDEDPPSACCCSPSPTEGQHSPYAARWAHVDDFQEIIISSHFLDDHSTTNVLRELERTAEVFGLSAPCYTVQEEALPSSRNRRRRSVLSASFWR